MVAGLAVLLAMTAAGSGARVGRGPSVGSTAVRLGFDALEFLAVVALLAGLALLVVGFPRMRRLRPDDEPEPVVERPPIPWYAKLLVLGLVVMVLAGLAGSLLVVRHQFGGRPVAPPASHERQSARRGRAFDACGVGGGGCGGGRGRLGCGGVGAGPRCGPRRGTAGAWAGCR